jgi:DNA-binding CsgD family transcriptional regulator
MSKRECEVLTMLMRDTVPKVIAGALYVSVRTIYRHFANLRKVFNVHTTREILLAFDAGVTSIRPAVRLTPRGKEVLELYMHGYTYRQIADLLGMSVGGVRRHREKMLLQNDCESVLKLIVMYRYGGKPPKIIVDCMPNGGVVRGIEGFYPNIIK